MIKVEKSQKTIEKETRKQLVESMKQKVNPTNAELRDLLIAILDKLEGV